MSAVDEPEPANILTLREDSPIDKVPEDVFALFAHFGFVNSGVASSVALSHVSTTFRRVVIDQATLWTELSSTFHIDQAKACIERSKNAGLQVQLYAREQEHYSSEEVFAFLDVVLPASARWEGVSMGSARRHKSAIVQLLRDIQARCSNLDFPRLGSLHLLYNLEALWDVPGASTYATWRSAPSLRQLHSVDFVARPSSVTNNITSLTLHYSERRLTLARDILTFLATTPLLRELSVLFHVLDVDLRGFPLPQIYLLQLKHFLLRLTTGSSESPVMVLMAVRILMRSISMPNLLSHSSSFEFPAHQLRMLDQYDEHIRNLIRSRMGICSSSS